MYTKAELTTSLDQVRANLSAIDLDASKHAYAQIAKTRQHIEDTATAARARCDELRPQVEEIERVGADRYDQQHSSTAFWSLLRGETVKRPTGDDILREYRGLNNALRGVSDARDTQRKAEQAQRDEDRAAIAEAMRPLHDLAELVFDRFTAEFAATYAFIRSAKSMARTGMPKEIDEAATAFQYKLGKMTPPAELVGALVEFEELFALSKVGLPTRIDTPSPQPNYALINAIHMRATADS